MITITRAEERGPTKIDWLDSRHTFSFGNYYNELRTGFGPLRVINEDRVAPGSGFATHGHRDMEIISYVLDGALEHKDSIGTGSIIRPGDVQRMSAGTGIRHSEYNHSHTDPVHFLQIWIEPSRVDLQPSYEQKQFDAEQKRGVLRLVGSSDGRDGSVTIHQHVDLYSGLFDGDERATLPLGEGRGVWVQIARGSVRINGETLKAGDGLSAVDVEALSISQGQGGEVLLFDLPMTPSNTP